MSEIKTEVWYSLPRKLQEHLSHPLDIDDDDVQLKNN